MTGKSISELLEESLDQVLKLDSDQVSEFFDLYFKEPTDNHFKTIKLLMHYMDLKAKTIEISMLPAEKQDRAADGFSKKWSKELRVILK